jgi:DNA-directed RNA polymerase specialized sigma24 family protein
LNSAPENDARFLELIAENRPKLLKVCRVYAWAREDRDDLYQEILFQIWRALPSLKDNSLANTWLYRIALNTAITFVGEWDLDAWDQIRGQVEAEIEEGQLGLYGS